MTSIDCRSSDTGNMSSGEGLRRVDVSTFRTSVVVVGFNTESSGPSCCGWINTKCPPKHCRLDVDAMSKLHYGTSVLSARHNASTAALKSRINRAVHNWQATDYAYRSRNRTTHARSSPGLSSIAELLDDYRTVVGNSGTINQFG